MFTPNLQGKQKEDATRFNFSNSALGIRESIYNGCDPKVLGRLFLTSRDLSYETVNLLIDRIKGAASRNIQCELLERNSHAFIGASRWIKMASKEIKSLRFSYNMDPCWLECLYVAVKNQKIIQTLILEINPGASNEQELLDNLRLTNLAERLRLEIASHLPSDQERVSAIFLTLPIDLKSLSINPVFTPDLSSYTVEQREKFYKNLGRFAYLPNSLTSLTLDRWVCVDNFFHFLPRTLRELRVTRLLNSVTNLQIEKLPRELKILVLDHTLGLNTFSIKFLPRTITKLFFKVFPSTSITSSGAIPPPQTVYQIIPQHFNELPPHLQELDLRVVVARFPKGVNVLLLKLEHIQLLPKGLRSFTSLWNPNVTEEQIRFHLTNLTQLKNLIV